MYIQKPLLVGTIACNDIVCNLEGAACFLTHSDPDGQWTFPAQDKSHYLVPLTETSCFVEEPVGPVGHTPPTGFAKQPPYKPWVV